MPTKNSSTAVRSTVAAAAPAAAPAPAPANQKPNIESFVSKLAAKDKLNAERHLAACEAEEDPRHASLWLRIACHLKNLAPHATKVNGRESIQFYEPDGRYKKQVFALHDNRDGKLSIYCTNVLKQARTAGILSPRKGVGTENTYAVPGSPDPLMILELDETAENPPVFFKHMLGWSRKALCIVLPTTAAEPHIKAVEALCTLSIK
jgi:hypothetical protein